MSTKLLTRLDDIAICTALVLVLTRLISAGNMFLVWMTLLVWFGARAIVADYPKG